MSKNEFKTYRTNMPSDIKINELTVDDIIVTTNFCINAIEKAKVDEYGAIGNKPKETKSQHFFDVNTFEDIEELTRHFRKLKIDNPTKTISVTMEF